MKILKFTCKLLTAFLLFIAFPSVGQNFTEQSIYKGSYKASDEMTLEIKNKYGNIQLINWDKDSIQITTDVYLSATSQKKLDKFKKSLSIKYTASEYRILAETKFESNSSQFFSDIQAISDNFISTSSRRIEVNYVIYVPENVSLDIENQYGDVIMENNSKKVSATLSNGSFIAGNITSDGRFNFRYIKSSIKEIVDAEFNLHYSELNINKAINLNCTSRSSEINITEVTVLKLKSNRDEIRLEKVGYLYGAANYPKLRIDYLSHEINYEINYGTISIDDIAPSCKIIDLYSDRSEIEIYIPKTRNFSYDIIYDQECTMHFPIDQEPKTPLIAGQIGLSLQGETGQENSFNIRIKAIKKSIIKVQYSLKQIS